MQCLRLVRDPNHTLVAPSEKCPLCGQSGTCRRGWPSSFGYLWMQTLNEHKVDGEPDRYFLVLMLCACAEHLLGELDQSILRHQGAKGEHIDILLDLCDGRRRLLELFKNLTGKSFEKASADVSHQRFWEAWSRLTETRNHIAHGVPPVPGLKTAPQNADTELVRDTMLDLFAALHNVFAA